MRKVYKFHQLRKSAKKKAAKEVYEIEIYKERDWTHECRNITEDIKYRLNDYGLNYGEIYWDSNYGISIDLTSVSMTDDYLKKILSEKEIKQFDDLNELCGGYIEHRLFDGDYKRNGYEIVFDYALSEFPEKETMEYIMEYSEDEDLKLKYKLPLLLESELSEEAYKELETDIVSIGEQFAQKIGGFIADKIEALVNELKKMVRNSLDYLESEEFYYDELDNDCYVADIYLFNYQGEVILRKNEFVNCEYEEIYHDAA